MKAAFCPKGCRRIPLPDYQFTLRCAYITNYEVFENAELMAPSGRADGTRDGKDMLWDTTTGGCTFEFTGR
ncbi:uncharacterized protein N7503_008484 [Penicillium pulvis]|uniref:uncharacterized protein n=1 Tax=Penicillium pulvis TaxID=1562058 RepID=UPI002546C87F|nr:uncharacterized protein N7503_008484 [Penicillium pulvis]KAJ5792506.1 hypothetical protein N7503_008484 [Penicillium pulvis]